MNSIYELGLQDRPQICHYRSSALKPGGVGGQYPVLHMFYRQNQLKGEVAQVMKLMYVRGIPVSVKLRLCSQRLKGRAHEKKGLLLLAVNHLNNNNNNKSKAYSRRVSA